MATVGKAEVLIIPKFTEFNQAVKSQVEKSSSGIMDGGKNIGYQIAKGANLGLTKTIGIPTIMAKATSSALSAVSASISGAVSRFDTMNNFPRVMQQLGYSAKDSAASIQNMSDRLQNLPTRLDTMAQTVKGLVPLTGDINKATAAGLALNDMLMAGGGGAEAAASGLEQMRQILAKGKPEMQDWKILMQAMPGQLDQLAKHMLGPTANANDLYEALGGGKAKQTISMDALIDEIIKLDTKGGPGITSFKEQAETASAGVQTSLANMQNAIVKGVAGVMDTIGEKNIAGVITDAKNGINSAFKVIKGIIKDVSPAFKTIYETIKPMAPQILTFGASFAVLNKAQAPLSNLYNKVKPLVSGGFSIDKLGGSLKELFNTSKGSLALTGVAAAVTLVGGAIADAVKKENDFKKATDGISSSVSNIANLSTYKQSLSEVGIIAGQTAKNIDELREYNADLSDSIASYAADAQAQIGPLNTARTVIESVAGATDLSAQKQGELRWALQLVNQELGTNYTETDAMSGAYEDANGNVKNLKDSLDKLIEKRKEEIQLEANTKTLKDLYSARAEDAKTVADAQAKLIAGEAELQRLQGTGSAFEAQAIEVGKLKDNLDEANAQYQTATDSIKQIESEMGREQAVVSGSANEWQKWASTVGGENNAKIQAAFARNGASIDAFCQDLEKIGLKTSDLKYLTDEELTNIALKYDGSTDSIVNDIYKAITGIDNWNAKSVEEKNAILKTQGIERLAELNRKYQEFANHPATLAKSVFINGEVMLTRRSPSGRAQMMNYATGGIRYHADGGAIVNAPRVGYPLDMVGEDGAEAIVPLTNEKYSRPFVNMIAEETAKRQKADVGAEAVISWLSHNLPAIIQECTPTIGSRDFSRMTKEALYAR